MEEGERPGVEQVEKEFEYLAFTVLKQLQSYVDLL